MAMQIKPLIYKLLEVVQNSDLCTSDYRSIQGFTQSASAYDELFYLYLDSFNQMREIDGYRGDVCHY